MSRFHISEALWKQIHNFSTFPQTGVSLQQMVQFGANPSPGTLYRAGQFLAEELPVRLAHRVRELDTLPNKLNEMPSIEKVKAWYAQSFEELVSFPWPKLPPEVSKVLQSNDANAPPLPHTRRNPSLPPHLGGSGTSKWGDASKRRAPIRYYANPRTPSDFQYPGELLTVNEKFADLLSQIKTRHDPVVTSIAQGILEYKKMRGPDAAVDTETRYFLDRFYMSRIGIRVLIGQHIALCSAEPNPDYVGVICTKTNLHDVASQAIDNATFVCEDFYNVFKAPTVHLKCPEDLTFMYIPSHLNHILFEIIKNSLRATVERFGVDCEEFPPIHVIVAKGKEDITIKISDEGGGIARTDMPNVWTYMFTTANPEDFDQTFEGSDFKAPLAGFGYGLPISRLYAQYLGGGLKLMSLEGHGCDVYVHLSRLSENSEPLQ